MNYENQKRQQEKKDVDKTLAFIRRKVAEEYYGKITLTLSAGFIRRITTEQDRKPDDLI